MHFSAPLVREGVGVGVEESELTEVVSADPQ